MPGFPVKKSCRFHPFIRKQNTFRLNVVGYFFRDISFLHAFTIVGFSSLLVLYVLVWYLRLLADSYCITVLLFTFIVAKNSRKVLVVTFSDEFTIASGF